MKLNRFLLYVMAGLLTSLNACKQDNYPAPDAGIQGTVTDVATGAGIQTEQPNGIRIRLIETKYGTSVTPNDFWCRVDGSFKSTTLFSGQYKVVPIEGAFFPADTASVNINGLTEVNFKVTPYLTIKATITTVAGGVRANYTIARTRVGDKINQARVLVSAYPTVSNTVNEFNKTTSLTGVPDATILATPYTETITGLASGKTYYVRVAARTSNALSRFNYSEIVKVIIP